MKLTRKEFLHFPENGEEWLAIAAGFEDVCQLPHCVGAADGKHVRILHPHLTTVDLSSIIIRATTALS